MKNPGSIKMFLSVAILLAIAEIVLLAIGNGSNPVSGLILFVMFYALSFTCNFLESTGTQGKGT